jgi:chaperonin GroES
MSTIEPLGNNIVIGKKQVEVRTKGGLLLPDESSVRTEVISIGPDTQKIKVGDAVIFDSSSAKVGEFEGEKYIIISEDDVVALIKGE